MKILLTEKQVAMLDPLFLQARVDGEQHKPGMIVGQFVEASDGSGFFEVGYLPHDNAVELQKALGNDPDALTPAYNTVYSDV